MSISYQQIPNFMKQREQGIPGVPFVSLIQFAVALGVGFTGYALGLPIILIILLVIVALLATIISQGEYIYSRLFTIGVLYVKKMIRQNGLVEIGAWSDAEEIVLEDHERATISMDGSVLASQE